MKSVLNLILLIIFLIGLTDCTSVPRYHSESTPRHKTAKQLPKKTKNKVPLLIKGSNHTAILTSSYYGPKFHGRPTASGEIFDMNGLTAAHKTLQLGTIIKVTYPKTGKSVIVKVNDRGPFIAGRDLDLSLGAAKKLGLVNEGVGKVNVTIIKWGTGKK